MQVMLPSSLLVYIMHIHDHYNFPTVQWHSSCHCDLWHKHSRQIGPPAKQQEYSVATLLGIIVRDQCVLVYGNIILL